MLYLLIDWIVFWTNWSILGNIKAVEWRITIIDDLCRALKLIVERPALTTSGLLVTGQMHLVIWIECFRQLVDELAVLLTDLTDNLKFNLNLFARIQILEPTDTVAAGFFLVYLALHHLACKIVEAISFLLDSARLENLKLYWAAISFSRGFKLRYKWSLIICPIGVTAV